MKTKNVSICISPGNATSPTESFMLKTSHQSKSILPKLMKMVGTVAKKTPTFSVVSLDPKDFLMLV